MGSSRDSRPTSSSIPTRARQSLGVQSNPQTTRWPALAVNSALPATDPIRAGQALFAVQSPPCHKLNGAGASDLGPDLNLPQNPTEYFTPQGLHDLIRNPRAVRTWPALVMPAFTADSLSDREIALVVAYLKHMAGGKQAQ